MKSTSKIAEIISYRKNHTLADTGKKFKLTSERIRQIQYLKNRKRCKIHNRYYYNTCSYCLSESYRDYVRKLDTDDFYKEVRKEKKNRKRDYLSVWRRVYIVERLSDIGYTYMDIAYLLDRDYSTIKHLYRKLK